MRQQAARVTEMTRKKRLSREEREALILEYLPKVRYVAGRLAMKLPSHVEMEDLISCGITGLIDAVDRFDPAKNVKFSTYAEFRIRGAMLDYLREMDWFPRSIRQRANALQQIYADLEAHLGRPPEEEEVARELGITVEELRKELSLISGISLFSLDDLDENDESTFSNRKHLAAYLQEKRNDEEFLRDMKELLAKAIEELPENEKLLISLYYYEEMTMREIGAILGLTESRICQIHNQAILRLRGKIKKALA
ncbi:MAG: FliA/WhiG family RNA polymerase sigma factor [Deltaproteobacteria bacterium]|nr:MAG: FliA/WhiG family RNA polymerase sigma factor [Deltaproteobacteria bacterium]